MHPRSYRPHTRAAGLLLQVDRLNGMKGGKMKPELAQWLTKRITLLSKMKDEL